MKKTEKNGIMKYICRIYNGCWLYQVGVFNTDTRTPLEPIQWFSRKTDGMKHFKKIRL